MWHCASESVLMLREEQCIGCGIWYLHKYDNMYLLFSFFLQRPTKVILRVYMYIHISFQVCTYMPEKRYCWKACGESSLEGCIFKVKEGSVFTGSKNTMSNLQPKMSILHWSICEFIDCRHFWNDPS